MRIPTPRGERRCCVGTDYDGEPAYANYVRAEWADELLDAQNAEIRKLTLELAKLYAKIERALEALR